MEALKPLSDKEKFVIRGGSWRMIPHDCRSAKRSSRGQEVKQNELGFRVVLFEMP